MLPPLPKQTLSPIATSSGEFAVVNVASNETSTPANPFDDFSLQTPQAVPFGPVPASVHALNQTTVSPEGKGVANPTQDPNQGLSGRNRAIAELKQSLNHQLHAPLLSNAEVRDDSQTQAIAEPSALSNGDRNVTRGKTADPKVQPRRRRKKRQRRPKRLSLPWSIPLVIVTACFSGVSIFAFRWMTSLPPTPNCQELSALSSDLERLHCAHLAAESGEIDDLIAGLDLVRPWTREHQLFWKAESMMKRWSKDVLAIAEATLYSQGLDDAIAMVEAIPTTSPLADQAQATLSEWRGLWAHGEAIVKTALDAVQTDQWDVAAQQVVELGKIEHDYWRQERANQLSLRIIAERQGQQVYEQAKTVSDSGDFEELAIAITQLQELDPQTFVWAAAQSDLKGWSQTIAEMSLQRFNNGDIDGALALIQALPAAPDLLPGETDLMQFGYAQRQANDDHEDWTPGLAQAAGFMMALDAAGNIPPDSPFYDQAQIQMMAWRRELRELTQLQIAQAIAATGHRWAFEMAMEQASLVPQGQPRRLQAQTLIAHWRQEIERVEDRPGLALARRMAAPGTIPALNEAIAQAQTVPADRALRTDADAAIAKWAGQIQAIEDQPILNNAIELADAGNLNAAISEAQKISSDRSLYASAQENIGQWRASIAEAENRALLARARSLAAETRLTEAINVASSVSSANPALYQAAQAEMAVWRSQRDQIWTAQNPVPSPSPSPSPRSSPSPSPAPSSSYEGFYDLRYYDR